MKRKSLLIVLLIVALLISVRSVSAGQLLVRRAAGSASVSAPAALPGPFNKNSPPDNSTQGSSVTLSWGASSGVANYKYCYDTQNNDKCDKKWVKVGLNQSATVTGLKVGKTYYWTVVAKNSSGKTKSDNGVWWTFKVSSTGPYPPPVTPTPSPTPYP